MCDEKPNRDGERVIEIDRLNEDCMTLALRLLGEDEDTFAPETMEVMDRWRPKCIKKLQMA